MRAPFAVLAVLAALVCGSSVTASPVDAASRSVKPGPKRPAHGYPQHPPRRRTCPVKTHGDGITDDTPSIMAAIRTCNNGGRVLFKKDATYTVGTAMDLSFLRSIDLDIQGTIKFTNDTDYWQVNSFRFGFQNVTTFFKLGGSDVNVYGGGTLDGNGQKWYDLYAKNIYTLRPVLIGMDGLHKSSIQDLKLRYSPQYYMFIANSTDVVFDGLDIAGASTSSNPAKNTDGLDSLRSSGITFQNSKIVNGDDCYSAKPNSTNILIQNLSCDGSHGISIGSLGQYKGVTDIVEDVYVYNISMSNASDGARIKVWPGVASALSGDLQGGGGTGRVRNVTYDTMTVSNVDYGIEITQCYGQKNQTLCNEFPSSLTISDILFKNIAGTSSGKYEPFVGHIVCSSPKTCSNIRAVNVNVVSPKGSKLHTCQAVDDSLLQLQCTDANSPAN